MDMEQICMLLRSNLGKFTVIIFLCFGKKENMLIRLVNNTASCVAVVKRYFFYADYIATLQ